MDLDSINVFTRDGQSVPPQDGDTVVNEKGGKQAHVSVRLDLIPALCSLVLGGCLGFGAKKYGEENWKLISFEDHFNHCLTHLRLWQSGDRSEPHLVNAYARLTFALWLAIDSGQQSKEYVHPEMTA